MEEHYEALEADFQREYRINLREELADMDIGRLHSLITGLSPQSSTVRAIHPSWYWNHNEELLATLIEMVDRLYRAFVVANSEKKGGAPNPVKIPRPYQQHPAKGLSMSEFRSMVLGPDSSGSVVVKRGH